MSSYYLPTYYYLYHVLRMLGSVITSATLAEYNWSPPKGNDGSTTDQSITEPCVPL